jgi:hypothetical protein
MVLQHLLRVALQYLLINIQPCLFPFDFSCYKRLKSFLQELEVVSLAEKIDPKWIDIASNNPWIGLYILAVVNQYLGILINSVSSSPLSFVIPELIQGFGDLDLKVLMPSVINILDHHLTVH